MVVASKPLSRNNCRAVARIVLRVSSPLSVSVDILNMFKSSLERRFLSRKILNTFKYLILNHKKLSGSFERGEPQAQLTPFLTFGTPTSVTGPCIESYQKHRCFSRILESSGEGFRCCLGLITCPVCLRFVRPSWWESVAGKDGLWQQLIAELCVLLVFGRSSSASFRRIYFASGSML